MEPPDLEPMAPSNADTMRCAHDAPMHVKGGCCNDDAAPSPILSAHEALFRSHAATFASACAMLAASKGVLDACAAATGALFSLHQAIWTCRAALGAHAVPYDSGLTAWASVLDKVLAHRDGAAVAESAVDGARIKMEACARAMHRLT